MPITSPRSVIVVAFLAGLSGCAQEAKAQLLRSESRHWKVKSKTSGTPACGQSKRTRRRRRATSATLRHRRSRFCGSSPGVVEVEVLVAVDKPARRLIHLRDWHYVAPELHALDVRHAAGKPLDDAEVGLLYRQHLLEVELVQCEQEALLRCLAKHHIPSGHAPATGSTTDKRRPSAMCSARATA